MCKGSGGLCGICHHAIRRGLTQLLQRSGTLWNTRVSPQAFLAAKCFLHVLDGVLNHSFCCANAHKTKSIFDPTATSFPKLRFFPFKPTTLINSTFDFWHTFQYTQPYRRNAVKMLSCIRFLHWHPSCDKCGSSWITKLLFHAVCWQHQESNCTGLSSSHTQRLSLQPQGLENNLL